MITAVEDLVLALLQLVGQDGTRFIGCLQSARISVPKGWRNWCPVDTLSRVDAGMHARYSP
jgi:hypothetical protein